MQQFTKAQANQSQMSTIAEILQELTQTILICQQMQEDTLKSVLLSTTHNVVQLVKIKDHQSLTLDDLIIQMQYLINNIELKEKIEQILELLNITHIVIEIKKIMKQKQIKNDYFYFPIMGYINKQKLKVHLLNLKESKKLIKIINAESQQIYF